MKKEFREKMVEDLKLREMSTATVDLYVRMVRKLEEFTGKRADKTTQKEKTVKLNPYLLNDSIQFLLFCSKHL